MFPTRISLVAAGLVLMLAVLMQQTITSSLGQATQANINGRVERAAGLFLSQNRLQALEFTNETAGYARHEAFPRIFTIADETARRKAANEAANELNNQQIQKAHDRRAELVAVVDAAGKVVARDLNINAMYGEDFKARYPSVAAALLGNANKDVWAFSNRMYRVSSAPIRGADGRIVGALIVAFEESAHDARALKDAFGTEVVVFLDNKIYASSFAQAGKESLEEQDLSRVLFTGSAYAAPAVKERKQTAVFTTVVQGETYRGVAAPMLGNTSQPAAGFVVLSSLDAAQQPIRAAGMWILGLGIIAALATMAAAAYTSRRFLASIDLVEQGVTEIINGNHEYVFEKQGNIDFEGLENALNVMVSRLTGRPDPNEEGGTPMSATLEFSGGNVASPRDSSGPNLHKLTPENQTLAAEPEDKYQRRLFDEYVRAREETGEGTRDLSFASFIEKLKDNEIALCKKYNCRAIRFKVIIKANQVTLKPVPLH